MESKRAIVGAQLIDGVNPSPIPASAIVIGSDGRIVDVGPQDTISIPQGTPVLEAKGMTIMPGLIDAHQHLAWDKHLYSARSIAENHYSLPDPHKRLLRAAHHAQTALSAGVTTVRDCGADDFAMLALRDMIDQGVIVGPRILACGKVITTTAGHQYTDWGVDSIDEMRKAVRLLASRGVDFVKLLLSGGTTTPGSNISRSQYSLEELQVAVGEAHRLGLQIAVHAISTDSIRLAAEAGVDSIEHCSWIGTDPRTAETDERAVEWMVKHGVRVDHAIIPRPYLFPQENSNPLTAEEEWWLSMLRVRWPFLHQMKSRGVIVFIGSDAAYGLWPGTDMWPGFQEIARAVQIMVDWAGFTPFEAIAMATSEAAIGLKMDADIGSLQQGKRADLILLSGDPLTDVAALRDVDFVFRDGDLVADHGRILLGSSRQPLRSLRGWELPT